MLNKSLLFICLLVFTGCVHVDRGVEPVTSRANLSNQIPTNYYQFKLIKVIDGDTIRGDLNTGLEIILENQTIRLLGVDTPETRTKDLEEKKAGLKAKHKVEQLLNNADQVWISIPWGTTRDSFGRILADVWADQIHVNSYLIENDLAEVFYP